MPLSFDQQWRLQSSRFLRKAHGLRASRLKISVSIKRRNRTGKVTFSNVNSEM